VRRPPARALRPLSSPSAFCDPTLRCGFPVIVIGSFSDPLLRLAWVAGGGVVPRGATFSKLSFVYVVRRPCSVWSLSFREVGSLPCARPFMPSPFPFFSSPCVLLIDLPRHDGRVSAVLPLFSLLVSRTHFAAPFPSPPFLKFAAIALSAPPMIMRLFLSVWPISSFSVATSTQVFFLDFIRSADCLIFRVLRLGLSSHSLAPTLSAMGLDASAGAYSMAISVSFDEATAPPFLSVFFSPRLLLSASAF